MYKFLYGRATIERLERARVRWADRAPMPATLLAAGFRLHQRRGVPKGLRR
jgi:hypothetical protein